MLRESLENMARSGSAEVRDTWLGEREDKRRRRTGRAQETALLPERLVKKPNISHLDPGPTI